MSVLISIPSNHLKYLIPAYQQRLKEISALITELNAEKEGIEIILHTDLDQSAKMNIKGSHSDNLFDEYDKTLSWFGKAKFIIQKEGKPLSTSEIADRIKILEPEVERMSALRIISSVLGTKSDQGKEILRFKDEKGQKFGLK